MCVLPITMHLNCNLLKVENCIFGKFSNLTIFELNLALQGV